MRILLSRRRSERGAAAIVTAVVVVVLLVVAAFVTDFGMAYTKKRQLQNGADAAALAAAQFYMSNLKGPCSQVEIEKLRGAAEMEADDYLTENVPGAEGHILPGSDGLRCNGGGVEVIYEASGDSPTIFGPLAGTDDDITTSRTAGAAYDGEKSAAGELRPWGICSPVVTQSEEVTFVPTQGGAVADKDPAGGCGDEDPPGGWWVAQCVGQGPGTAETEAAVEFGCSSSTNYRGVPGQLASMTATELRQHLVDRCPPAAHNDVCLISDPGRNFSLAKEEWQGLVGATITMPVFCFPPTCMPTGAYTAGTNASYAVQQIATVEICGFQMGGTASTGWPTRGVCSDSNPLDYQSSDVTSGDGLFLVIKGLTGGAVDWEGSGDQSNLRLTE